MADLSGHIPANALWFKEAFERLRDADPRTAEVRAELDRLDSLSGPYGSEAEWDDAWEKLVVIEEYVARSFREQLYYGKLTGYRRDPNTGQELRVPADEWKAAKMMGGSTNHIRWCGEIPRRFRQSIFGRPNLKPGSGRFRERLAKKAAPLLSTPSAPYRRYSEVAAREN
jgi:hypothetical protein